MSLFKRGSGRLFAIMAVAALVFSQSGSLWAESTGRQFAGCIQTCNDTKAQCNAGCKPTCNAMFPDSPAERGACKTECKDVCDVESDDCKLVCQNIKSPPSPEAP